MLLPAFFFASAIGSVILIVLALMMQRRKQRGLEQRLSLLPKKAPIIRAESPSTAQPADGPSNLAKAHRFLLLDSDQPWEMKTTLARLVFAAAAGAVTFWFKSRYLFGLPPSIAAIAAICAAYLAPRLLLIRERKAMEKAFSALFPDAVDAMARMLRAGLPVTTAFQIVSQEAPSPVNAVFGALAGQMRIGIPVEDALRLSAERLRIPDFQFFAAAVVLQRAAGGNLLPTLEALGQLMRSRRSVQLKARAVTAEIRLTAYILGSLPFVTMAAMSVMSPGYLSPLYNDPRGQVILSIASGLLLIAAFVIKQMMSSIENA
jgi:tight adherence protein B